ncbi:2-heptaprenyl-1,4-naphthoquinone methyltransferase [Trichodelitschia bisporula]|uniref:2-heptaprenyl-1,4-naphthoquinone methyltransferase n=1 Tax=Trichodelitschia bisporula TaxID=703511 RepID=A0A6G1HJT0_9PEZI|nr:2-heptaprenyl-1,4-naphthoquinone methyltransferase [Trichodelitschia bisporula]
MSSPERKSLLKHHTKLQRYYNSLESRLGYRLFLGGTRHFGLYENENAWPWPIGTALRRMEDHLFDSLALPEESEVLDAGCGHGYVAANLAARGLRVEGIDIVDRHVVRARQTVRGRGLEGRVRVRKGDYHDLSVFETGRFEGIYTMETLVHAAEPEKVLAEFYRTLRPGGRLALYEYDHIAVETLPEEDRLSMQAINDLSAMPANQRFSRGVLDGMLAEAGFVDVVVRDLSKRTQPLLWLFFVVGYIPYLVIKALGLQKRFVNTMAGVEAYRSAVKGVYRYTVVTARKPDYLVNRAVQHALLAQWK